MSALALVYFAVCALACLGGALATVASQNPIRGAMGLLLTIFGIAGLYLSLHAQLLAALQLIVYAGAVVILFVFVIMILGPDATGAGDAKAAAWRWGAAALFLAGFASALAAYAGSGAKLADAPHVTEEFGSIEAIGRSVYGHALVPFEMVSLLFIVAAVGALAIARGKVEAAKSASKRVAREAA